MWPVRADLWRTQQVQKGVEQGSALSSTIWEAPVKALRLESQGALRRGRALPSPGAAL